MHYGIFLVLLVSLLKPADSYRIVKSRYGDELRKWDMRELFALGPYPYARLIDEVRKRHQIPTDEAIKLRYRDADGDWITMDESGDAYVGRENLYVDVTVSGQSTPAPAE